MLCLHGILSKVLKLIDSASLEIENYVNHCFVYILPNGFKFAAKLIPGLLWRNVRFKNKSNHRVISI